MPDIEAWAANLHNSKAAVTRLRRHSRPGARGGHYDLAFVSEAQKRRRMLSRTPAHQYLTGDRRAGSAAAETGILLADRLPIHGHTFERVSEELPRFERVGKERWGQSVTTEVDGIAVTAITVHPVAAPRALARGDEGALPSAHQDAVAWLDAMVVAAERLGHDCIVGGDLNVKQHYDGAADLKALIRRHDLDGIWDGWDLLMVTPGLRIVTRRVDRDALPDHPLLRLGLNIRHK